MKLKILTLLFISSMIIGCKPNIENADVSGIKNKYLNIPYATNSESQKLDVYLPENIKDSLPVIVAIHGGAFMFGDKADMQVIPMLEGIKRGYAVVSINYRLSDESKFPTQINDVKTAIRWIKANASKYHFNPNKIAVWGGSAGGNLASLAGTSGNVKELEDLTLGNAEFSSNIQAVVDWFGPINFIEMDKQFTESGKGKANHNDADSPESKVMGKAITEIPELVTKANPETYISKETPPFFIQHGSEDQNVPTQQSINFYNRLVPIIGKDNVTIEIIKNAKHGGEQFEQSENINKVFQFLDKTLKNNYR